MLELISQLLKFMKVHRKFWMAPVLFGLIALGGLLVVMESATFAPLIYALF